MAVILGLGLTWVLPAHGETPRSWADILLRWPEEEAAGDGSEVADEAAGQELQFLETDRNSVTFAPFTAGPGRLVVESAYSFLKLGREGAKNSFPETVLRYGIGDRFELRAGYNYETGGAKQVAEGEIAAGFGIDAAQQLQSGFKYAVSRQTPRSRLVPNSALLGQVDIPVASADGQTQMRIGYVWGWILSNGWAFDQAIRFATDREGHDGYVFWAPSAVVRIPLGREKRWFTHLEYFGAMSQGKEKEFSTQLIDTGLHHFITPNFEVGAIVGFGINDQSRGIFVNTGFGIRF